jgi:hypothetical protein
MSGYVDGLAFAKTEEGRDRGRRAMECVAAKAADHRSNTTSICRCCTQVLETRGIDRPKVKIERILRVDLDGDGEEEVLISATNYLGNDNGVPMRSPAGSYSIVLLRRMVAGKVQTQLVEGEFYPKATGYNAPNAYKVIATLDLDGDGKLEVVVDSNYYEGEATTIYRCETEKG